MKRALRILGILAVVFLMIFAASCGENVEDITHTFDSETGTLVISGRGKMEDYGEYFIIKAIIEVDEDVVKLSSKENGVIGIDINVNHIMLCDIDSKGNIVGFKKIEYSLDNKSQNQRLHILRNVFSNAFEYAIEVGKPICMEDLDFSYKKRSMMYGNKRMNRMLSCFAYQKMKEISKSCSYHKRIGIIEVNPAYTSQIGRKKYMKIKGANVHMCASYVIGRKGMGYKE